MRCHPIRWLWGLIPIVMLSWIAVHVERDRIERDLEQRSGAALHQAGHDWASVVFSGRDGILVGMPPRRAESKEAAALVRGLWGVRIVEERTRLEEEAVPAAMATGVPSVSARADKVALPPLGPTLALQEPSEAEVIDGQPIALVSSAELTAPIVPDPDTDPGPDTVRAWELETDAIAGAEKTQEPPQSAAVETAALAVEPTGADELCLAQVRTINAAQPVRFTRGEADLDRPSRVVLDRLAAKAGACPAMGLKVVGHADAWGKAERNLVLSRRRARAVVAYLIDKGIDAGRLEAVGYGEARPVAPNDTAKNRAKNRRIELEITGVNATP